MILLLHACVLQGNGATVPPAADLAQLRQTHNSCAGHDSDADTPVADRSRSSYWPARRSALKKHKRLKKRANLKRLHRSHGQCLYAMDVQGSAASAAPTNNGLANDTGSDFVRTDDSDITPLAKVPRTSALLDIDDMALEHATSSDGASSVRVSTDHDGEQDALHPCVPCHKTFSSAKALRVHHGMKHTTVEVLPHVVPPLFGILSTGPISLLHQCDQS